MRGPSSSDLESMRAVANKSGFDADVIALTSVNLKANSDEFIVFKR